MAEKILIVDDDRLVLNSLEKLFTKENYDIATAQSGQEALEKVERLDFDLVIVDIKMPGINGIDTARRIKEIRKEKDKPDVPVVFITGYADLATDAQVEKLGEVFFKPLETKEFLENIKVEIERVPHDAKLNYTKDFVAKRREWLSEKTGVKFLHISYFSTESEDYRGNVENFVGAAQVPIGVVGPLLVKGDFANGIFYVPFATTEGALVETYQRGAIALTKSGGVKVFINKDTNHLDPIFLFKSSSESRDFIFWIRNNFLQLKEVAESTTGFGKLVNITPYVVGRRVITDFAYDTGDAMGANMINIATEKVCEFIAGEVKIERYLLRSNFSSEKKTSAVNLLIGYGKEVIAEAIVSKKIIKRFLFSTAEDIHQSWHSWALSSFSSGMLGINAHYANGLAAIFIACGQDVAHVSNASVGITSYEITETGDLYISLKLPNIIVGTVGGGTALGTQKECLEMVDCYGKGKAKKFAEIIGATLLAGEIGICAGITSEHFLDPHKRARAHTREKAFEQKS